jgi:DNA-binding MarR family transcriptional regulator
VTVVEKALKDADTRVDIAICLWFFAHRTLTSQCDDYIARLGLGRAHQRALFMVTRGANLTVGELARLLGISNQGLFPILKRLFDKGYLVQESKSEDLRRRYLVVTPKGLKVRRKLQQMQKEVIDRMSERVGTEGMKNFFQTMAAMIEPSLLPDIDHLVSKSSTPEAAAVKVLVTQAAMFSDSHAPTAT